MVESKRTPSPPLLIDRLSAPNLGPVTSEVQDTEDGEPAKKFETTSDSGVETAAVDNLISLDTSDEDVRKKNTFIHLIKGNTLIHPIRRNTPIHFIRRNTPKQTSIYLIRRDSNIHIPY